MGRARKLILFIGGREKGKSTRIEEMVVHWNKKTEEPIIILDPNGQARWYKYPKITLEQFKGLKKGIYRIVTHEFEEFFDIAFTHFKHGHIVGEDSSFYLTPQKNPKIFKVVVALRHPEHDVDLSTVTHSIVDTPMYMIRQANEVILFKTGDTWDDAESRIPDLYKDEFEEAFNEVNADPDPYAFRRIILQKTGTK